MTHALVRVNVCVLSTRPFDNPIVESAVLVLTNKAEFQVERYCDVEDFELSQMHIFF